MANYPSLAQLTTSSESLVDDLVTDRAVSGAVKVRAFYSAAKRAFRVQHLLNATDRATLVTFYNTNRLLTVSFTWTKTGSTYTCLFDGAPEFDESKYPYTQVTVRLVEQ